MYEMTALIKGAPPADFVPVDRLGALVGLPQRQEVADFVSTRIRHDMETQQELLRCRNFDELREVQTRLIKTAMDHYTAESTRLMEIGSEAIQRSANANG